MQKRFTTKDFLQVYQNSLEKALHSIYDGVLKDSPLFKDGSKEFIAGRVNEVTARIFSR
jgi:hypothetical protein